MSAPDSTDSEGPSDPEDLGDLANLALALRGSVALVTGAGSGIGRAAAQAMMQGGALVALVGRRASALEATAEGFAPSSYLVAPCDVSKESQVARMVQRTCERFGRLDVAFNNAGAFGHRGPMHQDTEDNFETVVGTNLRGLWCCMRHELAAMLGSGGGSIVNVASVSAHIGHAESPLYAATKHGVVGMSKSAALQYAHASIRVNVVSPGSTDTELLARLYPQRAERDARSRRAPLQRLGSPEEVASAALWLMSPLSSYVTGQVLIVDGGVTAGSAPTPVHQRRSAPDPDLATETAAVKKTKEMETSGGYHAV